MRNADIQIKETFWYIVGKLSSIFPFREVWFTYILDG